MQAPASEPEPMRFERIEVRPGRRQVLRDGEPVALGARAYDVLLALASQPGRVQSKDDLIGAVWAGQPIGDNNLVVQIATLRRALGPDCIGTVPGRGYQWTAGPPRQPAAPDGHAAGTAAPAAVAGDTAVLVGRRAELDGLMRAVAQRQPGSVLSIVGPAGIGKTVLARELIAVLASGQGMLPGAAVPCEVDLAALPRQRPGRVTEHDRAAVATTTAMALGATSGSAQTPQEQLLRHLSHRAAAGTLPSLLVLDNCEHVLDAVRELVAAIGVAVPPVRLLVTSQVPVNLPQETVLRLAPLPLPAGNDLASARDSAAVALFCRRAAAGGHRFELGAANVVQVADICRRLDGIPLALELAAARVPLLGVQGLHRRLDERFRLLRSGRPGEPARHQTLQAALDWSHDLLPPVEQLVLRRLAVFADGFTASAAQDVVCDERTDRWAVLDALGSLVDRSLVSPNLRPGAAPARTAADAVSDPGESAGFDEPRLRLLETVRDYARVRLQACDELQAVGRRHAEHFLALARQHGGGLLGGEQAAARRLRLAQEVNNLRAAWAWCLAHDPGLGLQLAASLILLFRELGLLREGRRVCAALLAASADDPPSATRMAVQVGLGAMAMEQDDAHQMQAMGDQVLHASRALGDRRREAHAEALLAHACASRCQLADARAHFERCLLIYREMKEPRTIAESLNNLAQCWFAEGRCEQALTLLEEALPLARVAGHAWSEAAVLQTCGDVRLALDQLDLAEALLTQSLELRRVTGHAQQVVMSLQSLALLHLRLGHLAAARHELVEATTACSLHGYGQLDGLCLLGAGLWSADNGLADAAVRLLGAGHECLQGTPVGRRPNVTQAFDRAWAQVRRAGGSTPARTHPTAATSPPHAMLALALSVLDGATVQRAASDAMPT
jgi:predicted ATPase/DNA-binding winged helix-turn-helix (wHTH) protein/Tfp pilus assembly protein PilF